MAYLGGLYVPDNKEEYDQIQNLALPSATRAERLKELGEKKTSDAINNLFMIQGVPKTAPGTSPYNNFLARSPLFAPLPRRKREICRGTVLATQGQVELRYHGDRLDMADQDVLLEAWRRAGGIPASPPLFDDPNIENPHNDSQIWVTMNRHAFLKSIGKTNSGANYKWLTESFTRLQMALINIRTPDYSASLHLIGSLYQSEKTGRYQYSVPKDTFYLFLHNAFGYVNMERRMNLKNNVDLAKWIQCYATSHDKSASHKIHLKRLFELTGMARYRDFKSRIWSALEELVSVGEFEDISIYKNDVVEWTRTTGKNELGTTPPEPCSKVKYLNREMLATSDY